jgi:hypothetical protein
MKNRIVCGKRIIFFYILVRRGMFYQDTFLKLEKTFLDLKKSGDLVANADLKVCLTFLNYL